MHDLLTLSLEGVKENEEIAIHILAEPEFMDVHEADLAFNAPVEIQGSAFVNRDSIVFNLAIKTEATMACAICNEDVKIKLDIPHFCHTEERIQSNKAPFSLRELVRDTLLLELPYRIECNSGCCRERATLAKFFKQNE